MSDKQTIMQNIAAFVSECSVDLNTRIAGDQMLKHLQRFLALLSEVNTYIDQSDKDAIAGLRFMDAATTMLNTFYRTRRDETYDAILSYIVEEKVSEQVSGLMEKFDPSDSANSDSLKALQTLLKTLRQWEKEAERPAPKPLLFIFDSVTLSKLLSGSKTTLITLKLNWDGAYGTGPSGMRTYDLLQRDDSSGDQTIYKRGGIYPIFAEGSDVAAAYIKLNSLDKDELQWFVNRDEHAIRVGFADLEQFKAGWDETHADKKSYKNNPTVWILRFSLVKD